MRPIPDVEGVTHRRVELAGLGVHLAEAGDGEPLVLVHGWPQHWYMWRKLIPELARAYRVICPDLRGFGWSDAPPRGYDKETLASDLLALIDALELPRVRVVGHDWGGLVGLLASLRTPDRVERVAALSIIPPWFRPPLSLSALAGVAYQLPIMAPVVGRRIAGQPWLVRTLMKRGGARGAWTDDELDAFAEQFSEPERAAATVELYRTFQLRELWPMALGRYANRRLTVPALAMYGERDPLIGESAFERARQHTDSLRVEGIAGAGHFMPEEAPEAVLERLVPFLSGSPSDLRPSD